MRCCVSIRLKIAFFPRKKCAISLTSSSAKKQKSIDLSMNFPIFSAKELPN
jgi:hypothetical protein